MYNLKLKEKRNQKWFQTIKSIYYYMFLNLLLCFFSNFFNVSLPFLASSSEHEISSLIKDITGVYNEKNRLNFNDEELITYSYC